MKANGGTRRSLRAPLLLAAVAGLALSASGCIIDSSDDPGCVLSRPDVSWQIVEQPVDGRSAVDAARAGGRGRHRRSTGRSRLTAFDVPCPASQTSGLVVIRLRCTGTYTVVGVAARTAGTVT